MSDDDDDDDGMVRAMKLQRELSNCWVEVRLQRRLYQGKGGSEMTN